MANMEDRLRTRKPEDDYKKDTLLQGKSPNPSAPGKGYSIPEYKKPPITYHVPGKYCRVTDEIARGVLTTPGTLTTLSEKFGISRAAVHQIIWGFGTTGRRFKKIREEILNARRLLSNNDDGSAKGAGADVPEDGKVAPEVLHSGETSPDLHRLQGPSPDHGVSSDDCGVS